jgi:hypothetical protein
MPTAETVSVTLGGTEYTIPPLSARRGLEAAAMITPYLVELRGTIEGIVTNPPTVSGANQEAQQRNVSILFDVITVLLPLFGADNLITLGHLLTDIDQEVLGEAPLTEAIAAMVTAITAVDFRGALGGATEIMSQITALTPKAAGPAPAEAPRE